LTIGLPKSGVVLCKGSTGFHAGCTETPEGEYDVIGNHNNWSPYVDEALPYASKITVIRHPVGQHVSSFHFFFHDRYEKKGIHNISVENFEKSMKQLHGKVMFPNTRWESAKGLISQNTFDLGLGELGKNTIEEAAKWAVNYYDLIMLTERFEESLILLKDMWQLDFKDIVSIKAKDNSAEKIFGVEDLTENLADFILEQNHLDVVLYKIASAALDEKINIFGVEKMAIEIELLKKERKKMIESCHEEETKENSECMLLELQGLELTNYIRKIKKQKKF